LKELNINWRRFYLQHEYGVKAVALGVLAVGIAASLLVAGIWQMGEIRAQIAKRKAEEDKLGEKVQILRGIEASALQERVRVLDQALPPRKDVVLYLATIESLSRELGLEFAGIVLAPGDVTEASESAKSTQAKAKANDSEKGLASLETEITIDGEKEQIYEFLRRIENSLPLMQVKDVKVGRIGTVEERYALSLRLGMLYAVKDLKQFKGGLEAFSKEEENYFAQLVSFRSYVNQVPLPILEGQTGEIFGREDVFSVKSQELESQEL